MQGFAEYFDRVGIINLPSRPDRLASIRNELRLIGFDPDSDQITVPFAPQPDDDHGFKSKGVYGNFLSHLTIIKTARDEGLKRVLILEDDAIFSRRIRTVDYQNALIESAESTGWGMWFIGHYLRSAAAPPNVGVVVTTEPFKWAHCYAVNHSAMDDLIDYLEATIERPEGHPEGGKMYIDGAFSLFRAKYKTHKNLICIPAMSIQKGNQSNLALDGRTLAAGFAAPLQHTVRNFRDEFWRWTGVDFRS